MTIEEIFERNEIILQAALTAKQLLENSSKTYKTIEDIKDANLFYSLIASLTAQAKAPASEKFVIDKLHLTKVSSSANRGDAKDNNNKYYEIKNSFSNVGEKLNLRQIRLWQDVDYYIIFYINEKDLTKSVFFLLNKREMQEEVSLMGGYTHGTKSINLDNKNTEYSITIDIYNNENIHTKRWREQYLSKDLYAVIIEGKNPAFDFYKKL